MASSKVASEKLRMWKNSRTVLKLTMLTKGGIPEMFTGEIIAFDEEHYCFASCQEERRISSSSIFSEQSYG